MIKKTEPAAFATGSEIFLKICKKMLDKVFYLCYNKQVVETSAALWKHSSVGRASALQAEGH
ncbi:MAG: hypothetical protein ACI3XL_00675, partial [Eubacteriales bacterium]